MSEQSTIGDLNPKRVIVHRLITTATIFICIGLI